MEIQKNFGHYCISNETLKCWSPIIYRCLVIAFTKCLDAQIFPVFLKLAKVVAIFKTASEIAVKNNHQLVCCVQSVKIMRTLFKLVHPNGESFTIIKLFPAMQLGF